MDVFLQILFKMLNSGLFAEINGCISTGKEANVYHAVTHDGTDLAVKVYKTSILVFKDRDRQVSCLYREIFKEMAPSCLLIQSKAQVHWCAACRCPCCCQYLSRQVGLMQVCEWGPQVQKLQQKQSTQDGQDVGGEGAAKSGQATCCGHPVSQAPPIAHACTGHGIHRPEWHCSPETEGISDSTLPISSSKGSTCRQFAARNAPGLELCY